MEANIHFERNLLKEKVNSLLEDKSVQLELACRKLKESEKNLIELNERKDQFFSIISHDLKSQFFTLLGMTEVLDKNFSSLNENKKEKYVVAIKNSSQRLYGLFENLLDWSKNQINGLDNASEFFLLKDVVNDTIEILKDSAVNKKIMVENYLNDDLYAYADKNMIGAICRNLISNAIKFSYRNGKIEISGEKNGDFLKISIKDNGIGMVPEEIKNIFKNDKMESKLGTCNESGAGIGLMICREFVQKNGGNMWVESLAGKGSKFYFSLPSKINNNKSKTIFLNKVSK